MLDANLTHKSACIPILAPTGPLVESMTAITSADLQFLRVRVTVASLSIIFALWATRIWKRVGLCGWEEAERLSFARWLVLFVFLASGLECLWSCYGCFCLLPIDCFLLST